MSEARAERGLARLLAADVALHRVYARARGEKPSARGQYPRVQNDHHGHDRMSAALFCLTLFVALASHPRVAGAEDRVWRVGLLSNGPPPQGTMASWRDAVLEVLALNGFRVGKNLDMLDRYSEGNADRLPQLAREISAAHADVIVAISLPSVRAALAATQQTPIVSVGSDPVASGFAKSFAHPGGTVTGIVLQTAEGDPKRLQLLSDAIPSGRHFGYLGTSYQLTTQTPDEMAQAATRLGIELTARWIDGPAAYKAAFSEMRIAGAAGVVIGANQPLASDAERVIGSATDQHLTTMCEWAYMARIGCVLSYGHDLDYAQRRAGEYVVRILRGAAPAELRVERSDAWKLTINSRAAQRLGLILPQALLARADEVIE